MHTRSHVVVVGAGYAGTMAANRLLSTHPDIAVTVLDPRPVFVERVRLHQLAAGTGTVTHDLADLLHPRAQLRLGRARRIDTAPSRADAEVVLDDGSALAADAVVYAVGSGPAVPAVPGAEYAHSVADAESAAALRTALTALPAGAAVTVVGAGPTGIETVSELARAYRHLGFTLVGEPGAGLPDGPRRYLHRVLGSFGVDIRPGTVTGLTDTCVHTDGTVIPSALTVWAGGFGVPDLARHSGLDVDAAGRLRVDATLRAVGGAPVIGVGDAACVDGYGYLRMSCQAAQPLGVHGADTAAALLHDRAPTALSLGFAALCLSLGRDRGLLQFVHTDDTPRRYALTGRPAALAKEAIVRSTVRAIRRQARGHGPFTVAGPASHRPGEAVHAR